MSRPSTGDSADAEARLALAHRRVMAVFTLVMMAISWPIWYASDGMPRFPVQVLAAIARDRPEIELAAIGFCLAGLFAQLAKGPAGRIGAAATAIAGLALTFFDQNRLQAWFYQALVLSAVYALLPANRATGFARFFAVTLYTHSALSKLDWSFAHSMGPYLLSPVFERLPVSLSDATRAKIAIALPVGELGFALALAVGYRRLGLAGAFFMHLGLLGLLGPWALDHSANVLAWNVSMLIQAWILFRSLDLRSIASEQPGTDATGSQRSDHHEDQPAALGLVQLGMLAVAFLPFFERAGLWDPWPSFALYAGHVEQLRIDWPAALRNDIPIEFRPFLKAEGDDLMLDMTLWSRARFGVPPYPATRIQKRLAAWIAGQCPENMPIRATFLSKAHWRTGVRMQTVISTAKRIR